jgi:ABC-2 type transport system ATP-binding protein
MNYLEVKNLRKSFKSKGKKIEAVRDISFNIKKGEILGFLGPNGAGKSTTINMVNGITTPDSGSIRILGKDPKKDWEEVKNNINVASAYEKLTDVLTVKQNLKVYGKLFKVKNVDERIDELTSIFRIKKLINRKASKLSSGEHTRLILCKALINSPKVLFMDECTVGLDPDVAETTRQIVKDYNQNTGASILFTSHYMYEVEELCKRVVFMNKGKIVKIGTPSDIKKTLSRQIIELDVFEKKDELKKYVKEKDFLLVSEQGSIINFEIDTKTHGLGKTLGSIINRGIRFKDLHIKKPDLNDFFIKLARKKEEEEDETP